MNFQYKLFKKSEPPQNYRRLHKTEPIQLQPTEQDERAAEAKRYLMDLNKEGQREYQPFLFRKKNKLDYSLAQWNNFEMEVSSNIKKCQEKQFQENNKIDSIKQHRSSKERLTTFEKELISSDHYKIISHRFRTNCEETGRKSLNQQIKSLHYQLQPFQEPLGAIQVSLQKSEHKAAFAKKLLAHKKAKAHKIDMLYPEQLNNSQIVTDRLSQEPQRSDKLPRLERMQAEFYKNKYKSIFRQNNTQIKYSLPHESPLCKEMNKISQLINEENIKLIKHSKK